MWLKKAFVFAAILLAPAVAGATGIVETGDKVKVISNSSTLGGGPFLLDDLTDSTVSNFLSFCIEYTEHISIGNTYWVKITDEAKGGGRSTDDPLTPGSEAGMLTDPLSKQTAYLYRQFTDGTLADYHDDAVSRDGLQLAIWRLEGEVTVSSLGKYKAGSAVVGYEDAWDRATLFFDEAVANTVGTTYESYGVRVMQLWWSPDLTTGARQDQLVAFPVPEPISTFSALLLGISALGLARRRINN